MLNNAQPDVVVFFHGPVFFIKAMSTWRSFSGGLVGPCHP
jgi:hypothetical protein